MKKDSTTILAIETSCDETAAAIIRTDGNLLGNSKWVASALRRTVGVERTSLNSKQIDNPRILSNIVFSQIEIHKKFGGVFPEVASRAHAEQIIPVIEEAIKIVKSPKLKVKSIESNLDTIDIIAVTSGPGLIGSLLVGVAAAKTLAYARNIPIMPINHWLGHIYSCFAERITNDESLITNPQFPLLALIASGGHTGLVLMKSHTEIITVGETLDDAAGEAFDKVAKILGLDYPGGPAISAAAEKFEARNPKSKILRQRLSSSLSDETQASESMTGQANSKIPNIKFPRAMLDRKGNLDFSFSGLKTSVLNKVRELSESYPIDDFRDQVAYEFQQCVIDILIGKTLQAAEKYQPKSICLCGGVSANKELRAQMKEKIQSHKVIKSLKESTDIKFQSHSVTQLLNDSVTFHVPPLNLTGDNAAMIGLAAAYQLANGVKPTTFDQIDANSNLKL